MFLVLKSEDNWVIRPLFWVSGGHFSGPTWGWAHRAEIGCLGSKNDFQKSIREPTLRVGESRKPVFIMIEAVFELNSHVF